jgi:O-antigen/teichoic acid export membrane protein
LLAFGLVFCRTGSLVAASAALALSWMIVVLAYDFPMARRAMLSGHPFFRAKRLTLWRLIALSLPLGMVMALGSLNANMPRYIIERNLGRSELGVFASLAYLVVAVGLIVNALGQSASTRLAKHFAGGEMQGFKRIMWRLLALSAAALVLGVPLTALFGRWIVSLLYTPQYAQRLPLLLVIVATAGVNAGAAFLGYGMTAARQFKAQVPITVITTVSVTVLTLVLVPRIGLIGAAWALLISSVIQCVCSAVVLRAAISRGEQ